MPTGRGSTVHELITRQPSALGSTARILNIETVSWVLIYTIDQDMDGQERTSTRKKIDRRHWGVEHGGHHCCVSCARWCRAGRCSGGLSSTGLAPTTPGQCGKLILPTLRWQWSVRAAATILPQAWATVWGSPVFLRRWGKHQWKRWTPAILPRRLARHGR
jgi:hypothetical protein